ncbi:methionyl-tRNA formyltransferase [Segetibacter sp. 3557_3]|uniref:formyltransferase family protein n=1 Tax=Segetibacter sp. 3557_3 TaxID=2547429 RepID=UPI001058FB62|nr:formyltransferase family protein [Segetibacter sp. 3557_3]TDH27808.1 methionyl-tRNA formyltransferase [Segetibacter sp. 3557_3]
MIKVDFAVCGFTAFAVFRHHVATFGAGTVGLVRVCANDELADDPASEILEWCTIQGIATAGSENAGGTEYFCFYIGWPVKPPAGSRNIVLHEGLLPRYRGYAPLVNSLISGEREIGVTALLAAGTNDDGPILQQEKITIDYPLTLDEAIRKIIPLCITIVTSIYTKLSDRKALITSEQDHYLATYCLHLHESDYRINWYKPSEFIKRTIDALGYPYAGVTANVDERQVSIRAARIIGDVVIENRVPGKVIFLQDDCPVVVCSSGLLAITAATFSQSGESLIPVKNLRLFFH